MADSEHLRRLINASGYAFQLAAEGVIGDHRKSASQVVAREHPWLHDGTGQSGFVDFVIQRDMFRFIVECKRTTDGDWLFLVPDATNNEASIFDCHWSQELDDKHEVADWGPVHFRPTHPLAQFCCVRGQGEGQVSFLDRIGSELIYATEAIASAEIKVETFFHERTAVYIPAIVTNARLHVATFATHDVNLTSGQVANCEFSEVPTAAS